MSFIKKKYSKEAAAFSGLIKDMIYMNVSPDKVHKIGESLKDSSGKTYDLYVCTDGERIAYGALYGDCFHLHEVKLEVP